MSLRGFHILFILIATLLCLSLAYFVYAGYQQSASMTEGVVALGSLASGLILAGYGVWFIRKSRRLAL